MNNARLSRAHTRLVEQCWRPGTCSVREILDSLPEEMRVAYTTVQTPVYRPEQKGALRESVIQSAHGGDLVSVLAASQPQRSRLAPNTLLTVVFIAVFPAGVFGTVSHTARCLVAWH